MKTIPVKTNEWQFCKQGKKFPSPLNRRGWRFEETICLKNSSSLPFFFISQRLKLREIVLGGFLSKKKTKLENLERERERGAWKHRNKSEED